MAYAYCERIFDMLLFANRIILFFLLVLSSFVIAHEDLTPQCLNPREVGKTYQATEAFVLLERLQYLGNTSVFVEKDWKSFVTTIEAFGIKVKDLEIFIEKECEILFNKNRSLEKLRDYRITLTGFAEQVVDPSVNIVRSVKLSGRILTSESCLNPIDCGLHIQEFSIYSMATTSVPVHTTGGLSSAGGGSNSKSRTFDQPDFIDYSYLTNLLPGFGEAFFEHENLIPYRSNVINVPKDWPRSHNTNDKKNLYLFEQGELK